MEKIVKVKGNGMLKVIAKKCRLGYICTQLGVIEINSDISFFKLKFLEVSVD